MPRRRGQVIITTHHFIVGAVEGGGSLKDFFCGRYIIYRIVNCVSVI